MEAVGRRQPHFAWLHCPRRQAHLQEKAAKETSCPHLQTLLFGSMCSNISFLLSFVGCLDRSKWKLNKHTLGRHYYVSVPFNTLYTCFDY